LDSTGIFATIENGPETREKAVAKTFLISIMRLPSLGSDDCQK
jgi:hypothetical protein